MNLILGITTFGREPYLNRLLESFNDTADRSQNWTVIIHNDLIEQYSIPNIFCPVKGFFSNKKGVHVGTNKIIHAAMIRPFYFAFKADDDIFFRKPGWEEAYIEHAKRTGFHHLSFNNKTHLPTVERSQGHFWTFTRQVIDKVGYFDAATFGRRGIGHIDFSMRCCRAGFNDRNAFHDAERSRDFIGTYPEHEYIPALPLCEVMKERESHPAKMRIVADESRLFVPYNV